MKRTLPGLADVGSTGPDASRGPRGRASVAPALAGLLLLAGAVAPVSQAAEALRNPVSAGTSMATNGPAPVGSGGETMVLPDFIPDPLEPVNRALWELNRGLLTGVIRPASTVYRAFVPTPVRRSIGRVGWNLQFPGRLANHLLQANWTNAQADSERFLANSVAGIGGIFDVATRLKVPRPEADFGGTFAHWGWKADFFLMLPVFGPSNDRDAVGRVGDVLADPWTYFPPYSYASSGLVFNRLSDSVESAARFARSQGDPYSMLRYVTSYAADHRPVDFQVHGELDPASLETLGAVFFGVKDPEFPAQGLTRTVRIPGTGRRLPFTFWMQPRKAPVVYIVPGLGAHRLDAPVLALAEMVYRRGYSAVCVSSAFHPEFIERAGMAALPAYAPGDAHDLHVALTAIDERLMRYHADQMGSRALMGYSMGAFHTLILAAGAETPGSAGAAPLLGFDRFLAINPPVRLLHGLEQLDACYAAPLAWAAAERTDRIHNAFLKVAALARQEALPAGPPPFSGVESRFLIGAAFRLVLRDTIYASQSRTNLQVLQRPIGVWKRQATYDEILQVSYHDYYGRFVAPYYRARGIDLTTGDARERATDLRSHAGALRADDRVRLVSNRNDILLSAEDVGWMEQTFPPARRTLFDHGGHLGNLSQPDVQRVLLDALSGL